MSSTVNFTDILMQHHLEILDSIFDGILIIDTDDIVLYVNPEYLRIVQVEAGDILGKPLRSVRPGAMLPDVVRRGRPVEGAYRREGSVEYVVDMSPIVHNGKIIGGVSVVKDITEIQRMAKELDNLKRSNSRLRSSIRRINAARYTFDDIAYGDALMARTVKHARTMAASPTDILITGESGTGKEVFAQAIHNASPRARGPFIPLNCATLSPNVIESELFGYADGAFTGARRGGKAGFFEVAEGGSIFLDEVNELPLAAQAKLLRVIEEHMVRRVGETCEIPADIRVIASSNRNLEELVEKKLFRDDLYYRLSALHLELPPLRRRGQDVLLLARLFAGRFTGRPGEEITFSAEVSRAMRGYSWFGNVRELRNVMACAANMGCSTHIDLAHLPDHLLSRLEETPLSAEAELTAATPDNASLHEFSLAQAAEAAEKAVLRARLAREGWSLAAKKLVAGELGVSLTTLYAKINKYGLSSRPESGNGKRKRP
ncbi:MAG: sigma 54-interacting transcriptional regulator [Deltaproteobacteria bacterium]|jgi:PAS domain S-box-containing protein|nr:sigma 54-interacting transcriptional regulator [Deltaproteobacteria bacterium]